MTTQSDQPVLEARDLIKHFPVHRLRRRLRGRAEVVHAVDDVTLTLRSGEVTALVGESGSGKSTIARLLAGLYPVTSGTIEIDGATARGTRGRHFREHVRRVQLVFQDPFGSLNPIHTIAYHLRRPLKVHGYPTTRAALVELLEQVNLTPAEQFLTKFPHELSGGQLQRIAIARALAAKPKVLLADEPVSMLDVSIRLGILNLLAGLVKSLDLAMLYITHDIASARYFASTTLVMYAGRVIEGGPSEELVQQPAHPYTRLLLESAPDPDRAGTGPDLLDAGEPPSLVDPPAGCRFHPRCPHAMDICRTEAPGTTELRPGHWTKCWLYSASTEPVPAR
ncbi:peptide/nickel transport system ATP-binding protein [Kribbella antiqua]|uniref:Peptide/nickel transport system ATP-binding protein n=1 Tax=Kribbella antiqua TaxID=2512217 RepID=A0A4R2J118_9ACTN|nr:ABC transporter ATP-binding protein [Kribbella antiqua]TCO50398.1 peptide/nickel transport system ATP-binding protein [Kribbella antiqua]